MRTSIVLYFLVILVSINGEIINIEDVGVMKFPRVSLYQLSQIGFPIADQSITNVIESTVKQIPNNFNQLPGNMTDMNSTNISQNVYKQNNNKSGNTGNSQNNLIPQNQIPSNLNQHDFVFTDAITGFNFNKNQLDLASQFLGSSYP